MKKVQQVKQLSLFDQTDQELVTREPEKAPKQSLGAHKIRYHSMDELIYYSGEREIVCCERPGPRTYRKDVWSAGSVPGYYLPEDCPLCNKQNENRSG